MKPHTLCQLAVVALVIGSCGCASIITGGDKKIEIASTPSDAIITVYGKGGDVILTDKTPAKIKLKKKASYFKGADYRLVIQKAGYRDFELELKHNINGWYFGNFGFGGLIGFLVVDPLTGGMWTIRPDKVDAQLTPGQSSGITSSEDLVILTKDQLTPEQQQHLERLN
jgi:hypothetical protein